MKCSSDIVINLVLHQNSHFHSRMPFAISRPIPYKNIASLNSPCDRWIFAFGTGSKWDLLIYCWKDRWPGGMELQSVWFLCKAIPCWVVFHWYIGLLLPLNDRRTASSTEHICNERLCSTFMETAYVQWILLHMSSILNTFAYKLHLFGHNCGSQIVMKIGRNIFSVLDAVSHSNKSKNV